MAGSFESAPATNRRDVDHSRGECGYAGRGLSFLINNPGTVSGLKWHHYAGTYSPVTGIRRLYLDGVLIAEQTGEEAYPPALAYHLTMGRVERASGIGDGPYTGEMYDVRVYDYALDQSAIALHCGPAGGANPIRHSGRGSRKFSTSASMPLRLTPAINGQFNGANLSDGAYLGATISGSSTISLTVSNITVNNAGLYQLLVTNAAGVTTNSIVNLTVLPATLVGKWLSGSTSNLTDISGFSPAGTHDAVVQSGSRLLDQ